MAASSCVGLVASNTSDNICIADIFGSLSCSNGGRVVLDLSRLIRSSNLHNAAILLMVLGTLILWVKFLSCVTFF